MNKKTSIILFVCTTLLTILMIGLGAWNYTSQERYIHEKTITLDEATQEQFSVALGGITPGSERSYTVHFKAHPGDRYRLTLDFSKGSEDALAKFINVEVLVGEERVAHCSLDALLNGEKITFPLYFGTDSATCAKIIYSMDESIGDEAQGTRADFNITVTSNR